jgi:hypothetical protein
MVRGWVIIIIIPPSHHFNDPPGRSRIKKHDHTTPAAGTITTFRSTLTCVTGTMVGLRGSAELSTPCGVMDCDVAASPMRTTVTCTHRRKPHIQDDLVRHKFPAVLHIPRLGWAIQSSPTASGTSALVRHKALRLCIRNDLDPPLPLFPWTAHLVEAQLERRRRQRARHTCNKPRRPAHRQSVSDSLRVSHPFHVTPP